MRQNWLSHYDGTIERWMLHVAVGRFRAFGIPRQDWPDMTQELATALIAFRHDPAKSNGAKPETVLCGIISNRLRGILRARSRDRARTDAYLDRLGMTGDPSRDETRLTYEDTTALRLDVQAQMAAMTPFERAICHGLIDGMTVRRIAEALRRDWHVVRNAMERIRWRFVAAGLDGWVKKAVA